MYKISKDPPLHKTLQILNKNRRTNPVKTCRKKQRFHSGASLFNHAEKILLHEVCSLWRKYARGRNNLGKGGGLIWGGGLPPQIWSVPVIWRGGLISATPNPFLAVTSFICLVAIFLYSCTEGVQYKSKSEKIRVAEMNRVAEIRNLGEDPLFLETWSVPLIYPPPK